jgi:cysteine desulfurase / selenocysteine lyase
MDLIYFDNGATSWPKPEEIIKAMEEFNRSSGGSPGRSGHIKSIDAGRVVYRTRESLAKLFNITDPLRLIFTKNATEALNISTYGLLKSGDHVLVSSMEHNSVMRPLRDLEKRGVEISVVENMETGYFVPSYIKEYIKKNTKAFYLTHSSNVTGTIMPVKEMGEIVRDAGILFIVDAAQSAGTINIDVDEMNIDLLAFTGHKSLLGPQGTGGLYIREGLDNRISSIMTGGTGSHSEFEDHPDFMPDKFEAGTINSIGIAGLGAGVEYILNEGIDNIRRHEMKLISLFLEGVKSINGIKVYGGYESSNRTSIVSFNIDDMSPSDVAFTLEEDFGILARSGLQCSPSAHKTIGSFPQGTVRFSFGYFNREEEVLASLEAIRKISKQR